MSFISDLKVNCPNTYAAFLAALCPSQSADMAVKLDEDDIIYSTDDKIINYLMLYLRGTSESISYFASSADYQGDKWDAYKASITTAFANLEA